MVNINSLLIVVSNLNDCSFSFVFYMKGWSVLTDFVREQSLLVQNLRPNTQYVFLVRARNSHGFGPPSHPSVPERTLGVYYGQK